MGMLFAVAITNYPPIASSDEVGRGEAILSGKPIPKVVVHLIAPDSIEMDIQIDPDYDGKVKRK